MTFSEPGTPDVENLYARIGTRGPIFALPGTPMWCRPATWQRGRSPPFAGEIRDGMLYGRGAVDMKGEIACFMAAALRHLARTGGKLDGSLSLLITGDEEGPAINGTIKLLDWLKARGETLDACIVGEPSSHVDGRR